MSHLFKMWGTECGERMLWFEVKMLEMLDGVSVNQRVAAKDANQKCDFKAVHGV